MFGLVVGDVLCRKLDTKEAYLRGIESEHRTMKLVRLHSAARQLALEGILCIIEYYKADWKRYIRYKAPPSSAKSAGMGKPTVKKQVRLKQ